MSRVMYLRAALRILLQPINLALTVIGIAMMVVPFVTGMGALTRVWVVVGGFTLVGIVCVVITLSLYEAVRQANRTEAAAAAAQEAAARAAPPRQ
jgi:hypothetical protein